MNKFTKEMVNDYADKLLIGLTEEENKMVLNEFEIIDSTIDIINNIKNIETVDPMSWCLDDFTVELREDIPKDSSNIEDILRNSDVKTEREIEVIKVVG